MLYYTGAIQPNAIQASPSKSLGGYVSSSPVPNDLLNNLFSNIDYSTASKGAKHTRVIAFLNTTGQTIDQFSLYINSNPDNVSRLKVGLVKNEVDEKCEVKYFESLTSDLASPLYVTLQECEGSSNALTVGGIPAGEYVGIFLQREMISEKNPEANDGGGKTCEDFYQEHQLDPEGSSDNVSTDHFEIVINTDDVETNLYVDAGTDRQEQLPAQSVTIIGNATSDYPVSDISWRLVDGPNQPTLLNTNSIALTVLDLVEGEYIFELSAKDFLNHQKSDTMQLTMLAEELKVRYGFFPTRRVLNEEEISLTQTHIVVHKGSNFQLAWNQSPEPAFYWFAEPSTEPVKTSWADIVQPLNNGQIGTGDDLFPEPIEVGPYRYYITTYPTQIVNQIEFKK